MPGQLRDCGVNVPTIKRLIYECPLRFLAFFQGLAHGLAGLEMFKWLPLSGNIHFFNSGA